MLAGVSVTCFLLSYLIAFAIEASRFITKFPGRNLLLIGMLVAGIVAHSIFLVNQFSALSIETGRPQLLANWFQWAVLGAWGLALACLVLTLRNPSRSVGLFLIPVVLGLIGLGQILRGSEPFQPETTIVVWRIIHGVSQLIGTMVICFGVAFGSMYLVQSHRLKSKKRRSKTFRLPALEFLQSMNRLSLFTAAVSLAIGLLSGVILNLNREGHMSWLSGGIVFTFALFVSALAASILELVSTGSLGGRRSAYLTIANFLLLIVLLAIVLVSPHGRSNESTDGTEIQPGVGEREVVT